VISVMGTKLPWYLMPLYPAVALIVGVQLDRFWSRQSIVAIGDLPRRWAVIWGVLALVCGGAAGYFVTVSQWDIVWVCLALAGTFGVAAGLVIARRSAIPVLLWGSYVTMLLLVSSSHWIWELGEDFDVKPVAILARQAPIGQPLWMEHYASRPSLDFYADRQVLPYPMAKIQAELARDQSGVFVLVKSERLAQLPNTKVVTTESGWTLLTAAIKGSAPKTAPLEK
jgi:hypothetical protein